MQSGVNHEMVPFILQSPNDSTWQVGPPVPRVTRWEFVLRFQDWTLEKCPICLPLLMPEKSNDSNSWDQRDFYETFV